MDALQQEEEAPHRFIRPAPTPQFMSDPPPPPQLASWYPNQFQYQPSHSTWPPPPPYSTPHQPNTNSAPPPYPQHHNNPYLPSPPPQHMPPSYSQPNSHQTWGNPNWAHRQGWEHPDGINPNNHEEDWAARARAWAAAKAVMEGQHQHQHQQSHYTTFPARPDEKNHVYRDPCQHVIDPHYTDMQQSSVPALNQQQFPVSLGHPQWPPEIHLEESSSFTYGPSSSYASDGHAYSTRDGALPADPSQSYHYQGINETNSSVCQQEVPSSYSSVPGKEEIGDQNMHFRSRSPLLAPSAQEGKYHMQPGLSDPGRGFPAEQRHYAHGNQPAESVADPSDQPLEFAPGFYHEYDSHNQHLQASYTTTDPAGSVAPASIMTPPAVPGVAYPSMPTVPSSLQFDPSFVAPPIAGHAVPMFGQVPGPNFCPAIPTVGASFGLGMGTTLHPAAAFDANGVSNNLEWPKKASVPSWLREEIKKSVITSSSQERPDNPIEEDGDEKSFARGGIAGSKNIDSSRLSDDEDDVEDDEEAARTAAINQEIKRVLTDVLLKVTDELFDEIASKVLSEEDPSIEVDNSIAPQSHEISLSPTGPTPKASAKVLIPVKGKETEVDDASEKSSSGFPGDVLGLASYASDDEDELDSSSNATTRQMHSTHPQPSNMVSEGIPDVAENGCSQAESGGTNRANSDNNEKRTRSSRASTNPTGSHKGLSKNLSDEDLNRGNIRIKEDSGGVFEAADTFSSKDVIGGKSLLKGESQQANVTKSMTDDSQSKESGRPEKHEDHDSKRRSADKDTIKQAEAGKLKADDKRTGSSEPKRDERHARKEKEKTHERNGSKDKVKDQGSRHGEKSRESDSRRSSSSKDDKIDAEKVRRGSVKDDINRKRDRERDEKEDRSRRRTSRDPSKHKRRRSPSVSPKAKSTKDNAVGSHANESSDQLSDDSRHRKLHSRKRSLSPSPSRSRRRQVLRSSHSKHSQSRHSPYSSLENKRGRRSRSKSPARHPR